MSLELPDIPDLAIAMAAAYQGIPFVDDEYDDDVPPLPAPVVEGFTRCAVVDSMSGARCTRGTHLASDFVHRSDDGSICIEWREWPRLYVPETHVDKKPGG